MFFRWRMAFSKAKISFTLYLFFCVFFVGIVSSSCKNSAHHSEDEPGMDEIDRAIRQEFLMQRDPTLNTVPTERLLKAMDYMKTARTTQVNNLTWSERGPNNIGGRCRAIMVDKRDATGNTVFAGSVSGGLFKTTNFTSATPNWTPVNDLLPNLAITCLVQDNSNQNIMYAGTGEGWFNIDAIRGAGIFKSNDGGATWSQLSSTVVNGSVFEFVQDIVIDNNGNLYAAISNDQFSNARGIRRSIDGGNTWTQVLGAPLSGFKTGRGADLEVASNGDIYATLGILPSPTQVMKSSFATWVANTGALGTWVEITPVHSEPTCRGEIVVAPSDPQRVYLMMQDSLTDRVLTFYRSNDGGATWTNFTVSSIPNLNAALNGTTGNPQTWYDLIAAVDPTNPDIVIVGGIGLTKSTDGGSSWSTSISSPTIHVDQHALVFFNPSTLFIGNDGGIYFSSNINVASPTYTQKNNGFNVTQFYGCDFHPTLDNYFLAGAQDNNTQKFTAAGINSTIVAAGGDGGIPHIRQTDGQLQIAATTGNNYYRSLNGGATVPFTFLSSVSNSRGRFINPTDFDDQLNVLYAGDDPGKYYYITNLAGTASGFVNTLTALSTDLQISAVKIDPASSATIWLAASIKDNPDATTSVVPIILKLSNANTTSPTVLVSSSPSVPANSYVSSIDVDPANANNILITLSNYGIASVWMSTNGGTSWTSLDQNGVNLPDMPIRWGMFAPAGAQLNGTTDGGIILGTDLGVWTASTINGTATQWTANNVGLANVPVYMIKYRPANTSLVAATHGRGLFTTPLTGVITGVSNNVVTKDFIKYISPDANQLLVVKGGLNTLRMQVQVYDATGKLLYRKEHSYQNLSIPISTWSKGSYIIKIEGNNKENFVQQFIKR
ncbi:MAG TPA: exo-alpha-sialidase [Chitinophagaceae bacterium]|nr:exo-alpha-sialidase [Chitinophagaceae bacterium]